MVIAAVAIGKKKFGWLMDTDWWNLERCSLLPYRRPVEPHSFELRNLCKQMNLVVAPSYEADVTSKDVFGLYCGARKVKNGDTVFRLSPPTLTTAQVMAQMWYVSFRPGWLAASLIIYRRGSVVPIRACVLSCSPSLMDGSYTESSQSTRQKTIRGPVFKRHIHEFMLSRIRKANQPSQTHMRASYLHKQAKWIDLALPGNLPGLFINNVEDFERANIMFEMEADSSCSFRAIKTINPYDELLATYGAP